MKYVRYDPDDGAYYWDEYFQYLESHRSRFPAQLYEFAARWEHYSLSDRESLHDSWVQEIRIRRQGSAATITAVELSLLGASHDLVHKLTYESVHEVRFDLEYPAGQSGCDLLVHEFRVEEDSFVHELLFASGKTILVRFQDFSYDSDSASYVS